MDAKMASVPRRCDSIIIEELIRAVPFKRDERKH